MKDCRVSCRTYLPELLARILASHPLQDLCATRVFLYECVHLVYVAVNDDVKTIVDRVVLGDLLRCEGFGHGGCGGSGIWVCRKGLRL
jgi:hypothetical protein